MGGPFTAACVQTTSGPDIGPSVEAASALVRDAAKAGADFVLMPETVNLMEPNNKKLFGKISGEDEDEGLNAFRGLARELGIWLLAGSLVLKSGQNPPRNTPRGSAGKPSTGRS